ncbi:hypothetical protein ACFLSJ_06710 [Verrucomicrobiota bacterium]
MKKQESPEEKCAGRATSEDESLRQEVEDQLAAMAMDVRSLACAEVRHAVGAAELVWGVDKRTGAGRPVWGKSVLEAIVRRGQPARVPSVSFRLDFESDEVEYLVAACSVIKGVPFEDEVLLTVAEE